MADFVLKTQPAREPSQQFMTKREQMLARIREGNTAGKRLRVEPKNDLMRQILRHPTGGIFRETGAAEWPDDTFTQRRLADGDIRLASDQRKTRLASPQEPTARAGGATTQSVADHADADGDDDLTTR